MKKRTFLFHYDFRDTEFTHASIRGQSLIEDAVPMSVEHFNMMAAAMKKAYDLGIEDGEKTANQQRGFPKHAQWDLWRL